jgi:hypothetical protein
MPGSLIAQDNRRRKDGAKQATTSHFIHPSDAKAIAGDHRT